MQTGEEVAIKFAYGDDLFYLKNEYNNYFHMNADCEFF